MRVNPPGFPELLAALDHDGFVSVCHKRPGGVFATDVVPAAQAPNVAGRYSSDCDVWFGVNPVAGPARTNAGRGGEKDVTRLAAVWADLDVKPGGLPDFDTARAVVGDLSSLLGVGQVALIASGHGFQPIWAIEDAFIDENNRTDMRALLRRWGRLVRAVAERRGGSVDSVFDLPRVLRVPGTNNHKQDVVRAVMVRIDNTRPLTVEELSERLDEYGCVELPEDREALGDVRSDSADWRFAAATCSYVRSMVDGWGEDTPEARHPWLVSQAVRLAAAVRLDCITGEDFDRARRVLSQRFAQLLDRDGAKRTASPGEVGDAYAWGRARVETFSEDRARRELGGHTHPQPVDGDLVSLVEQLRTWQDIPDPAHVLLALAAAATTDLDGEPVWLLQVAPPSGGKTVTIDLLNPVAAGRLNEVTAAGLLGWSRDRVARPTGVLVRVGERGLVTFGDLSSLLATSDRGGREQVFALLRRVYDGHVTRDVSPPGRTQGNGVLTWSGRVTIVAAVTSAIDQFAAHADSLGPRWVYVRLPDRDTTAKRRAAAMSRVPGRRQAAADAQAIAHGLVATAQGRIGEVEIPSHVEEAILDAALVTCWGRATVPRHGYGRREIDGLPVIEEPPRIVGQLSSLALGLYALGCDDEQVEFLTRRVALDSMPADRRAVLEVMSGGEADLTTAAVAAAAGLHRHVARRRLEELEAIGVVESSRVGSDDEDEDGDRLPRLWSLSGYDGVVVAEVFAAHREGARRWHEMWVLSVRGVRDKGADGDQQDEGECFNPRFVPPPDGAKPQVSA